MDGNSNSNIENWLSSANGLSFNAMKQQHAPEMISEENQMTYNYPQSYAEDMYTMDPGCQKTDGNSKMNQCNSSSDHMLRNYYKPCVMPHNPDRYTPKING